MTALGIATVLGHAIVLVSEYLQDLMKQAPKMTPGERKASLVAIIEECEEKNICGRAFMRAWMVWEAKSTQDAKTYVTLMAPFAEPGAYTHFDLHAPRFYMCRQSEKFDNDKSRMWESIPWS